MLQCLAENGLKKEETTPCLNGQLEISHLIIIQFHENLKPNLKCLCCQIPSGSSSLYEVKAQKTNLTAMECSLEGLYFFKFSDE